ncbi:MAG: DNA mismatch repair endonuclease MutL [Bacteroidales bacterium]|nr:DNA mismatch repair endonuclease MutL [Bacteroidales bacterium]
MLKVLPENISNLIAAGEVVTRPASVVKELVENAVDAGSNSISVVITDAGRTLIQVIDDGCGMTAGEAVLCFERHATSKISEAADLESITTFGFRGEALASIAAVAEVTLKTRRAEDETGTLVRFAASKLVEQSPVAAPQGSNFEIRNLFYNVPARRKFLKSDNAELKHIVNEFLRVALTRPSVAMRLISNGRDIYNLRPTPNQAQRIRDLFGGEMIRELVPLETSTSVVEVKGWIGAPEDARKTAGNQYLFVNGRYFRSPYFNKAVCMPYEKLIPDGYLPTYFIWLETAPDKVDVNIHPAKTEVKFEDEQIVFDILKASVREALGRNAFTPSIDFDMEGAPEIPTIQSAVSAAGRSGGYVAPPKVDFNPLFDPFEQEGRHVEGYGALFREEPDQMRHNQIVLHGKYIVVPAEEGLCVINIARARERIFYERYLECVAEEQPVIQHSLFPVTVKLSAADYLTLMEDPDRLASLGFDVRDFGDNSVVVYGLPDGFPGDDESVRGAIDGIVAALREGDIEDDYKSALAAKMAHTASLMHKESVSDQEARLLTSQLWACRYPSATADGRKVFAIITTDDLDKKL